LWTGIAQSVLRLATGWMVRGSKAGEGEITCTRPDRPWAPCCTVDTGYLLRW
jgi:hypothetical protein